MDPGQQKWDRRWQQAEYGEISPAWCLSRHAHLLPPAGRSLELACGLADNALWLAREGYESHARDSSAVALKRVEQRMREHQLELELRQHVIGQQALEREYFDILVVVRFLDRSAFDLMIDALKPEGLLFYQTFVEGGGRGPSNPDYLLKPGELLQCLGHLTVRAYEDAGRCGNAAEGLRGESCIVVQKTR